MESRIHHRTPVPAALTVDCLKQDSQDSHGDDGDLTEINECVCAQRQQDKNMKKNNLLKELTSQM